MTKASGRRQANDWMTKSASVAPEGEQVELTPEQKELKSARTLACLHGMVWCGMVWYGVVWCGMVWYGVVWYGMVWCGVVWYGIV